MQQPQRQLEQEEEQEEEQEQQEDDMMAHFDAMGGTPEKAHGTSEKAPTTPIPNVPFPANRFQYGSPNEPIVL